MSKKELVYVDPVDLVIVGLDTEDREEHPLFDDRVFLELDEHLVKSIMVYGVQQPVLVREEAGKTYVVDGRQRVRAAREASKRQRAEGANVVKVPTKSVVADDTHIRGIMITTNELRQEDDVLTKARKAVQLFDMMGDLEAVAIAFGRTKTTVRNWLSLMEADPKIHAAIVEEKISAAAGIEIARYPRDEQDTVLTRVLRSKGLAPADVMDLDDDTADGEAAEEESSTEEPAPTSKVQPGSETSVKKERKSSGASKTQSGIKRLWLRKALRSKAAEDMLSDDQRAVLEWFATGQAEAGTWFDEFFRAASRELES